MITVEFHRMNCNNITHEEHNSSWDRWENLKFYNGKKQSPFGVLFSEGIQYLNAVCTCTTNRISMHNPFVHIKSSKGLFFLTDQIENATKKVTLFKLFPVSYKVPLGISIFVFKRAGGCGEPLVFKITEAQNGLD